jgi:hypothetical protein
MFDFDFQEVKAKLQNQIHKDILTIHMKSKIQKNINITRTSSTDGSKKHKKQGAQSPSQEINEPIHHNWIEWYRKTLQKFKQLVQY